jgi:Spy/CpxP family protein refolding chaperone
MQASRDGLLAYRLNDTFDEAEYRKLVGKQADVRTEMMVDRETHRNAIQSVLTTEQQGKLGNMLNNCNNQNAKNGKGNKSGKGSNNSDRGNRSYPLGQPT